MPICTVACDAHVRMSVHKLYTYISVKYSWFAVGPAEMKPSKIEVLLT